MTADHRDIIAIFALVLPVLWVAIAVLVPASSQTTSSRFARVPEVLVVGMPFLVMATFEVRLVNALASYADPATRVSAAEAAFVVRQGRLGVILSIIEIGGLAVLRRLPPFTRSGRD